MATSQEAIEASVAGSSKVSYEEVQGIFKQHCVSCHNEDQPRAELVMTTIDGILAGSASGPVVVAGDPSASPLYLLAGHLESPAMPPNKPKIPQRELNKIRDWIKTGLGDLIMTSNPIVSMSTEFQPSSLRSLNGVSPFHRVAHLACSPDGKKIAIEGNKQIVFWDVQFKRFDEQAIHVDDSEISGLKYSIDGKYLWCAVGKSGESGSIARWNFDKQTFDVRLGEENDTILDFSVDRSGETIAMGTSSKLVKEIPVDNAEVHKISYKKHTDWVTCTVYGPEKLLLASGDRFGAIFLWDRLGHREFAALRGHTAMITSLAWHPRKDLLLSSDLSGMLRIWDLHSFDSIVNRKVDPSGIVLVRWLDSDLLLVVGKDLGCQVWKLQHEETEPKLIWDAPLGYPALSAELSENHRNLVVSGLGGQVELLTISGTAGILERCSIELPKLISSRTAVTFPPDPPKRMDVVQVSPIRESDAVDQAIRATERSLMSARQTVKELEEQLSLLRQVKLSKQNEK